MNQAKKINSFFSFFQKKIERIKKLSIPKEDIFLKKQFYMAIIDTLGKKISLPKTSNRERFVRVVNDFSDWKEKDKVSLPHLCRFMKRITEPKFIKLRTHIEEKNKLWVHGKTIMLTMDSDFEELTKLWPKEFLKPNNDISLEHFQHKHLFYKFRNCLIHEFREPGYGMDFGEESSPFYHSVSGLKSSIISWELVYPILFLEEMVESIIEKLRKYFHEIDIDPRICFKFGSNWIEELNN